MSAYRSDDIKFPRLSTQWLGLQEFHFVMTNERSENWYGKEGAVDSNSAYLDLIQSGARVIDVGANEGYTTVLAALKSGPKGKVLAFEPAAHNWEPLAINIAINGLQDRVDVNRNGVGEKRGAVPFNGEAVTPGNDVGSLFIPLDDYNSFAPDVIKIDVEGYELRVLKGAMEMLKRWKPTLFIEVHMGGQGGGMDMRSFGDTPEELGELLLGLGYEFFRDGHKTLDITDGYVIARHRSVIQSAPPVPMPRAFCITLGSTPDRRASAEEHFKSVGLDVEFVEGIDGNKFSLRTAKWSGEIKWDNALQNDQPYFCAPGQIGLTLSHRFIWQMLLHSDLEEALILEDDALFEPDFMERFKFFYAALPSDWQFCYVGAYDVHEDAVRVNNRIVIDRPYRTHAYMVRRSALPVLIESVQSSKHHVDVLLRTHALPKLKHYCFRPSLAKQRTAEGHWQSVAK